MNDCKCCSPIYASERGSRGIQNATISLWLAINFERIQKEFMAEREQEFDLVYMRAYCEAFGHMDFVE